MPASTLQPIPVTAATNTLAAIGGYILCHARTQAQVEAAQRLRYEVFNCEMDQGLALSHASGRDEDPFDAVCDHLLVIERRSGAVVGTYRMQRGCDAARHHGYYCAREFHLDAYEPLRSTVLELGRACIHARHRGFTVLSLLWRGIAEHAQAVGARYLIGCSSISTRDPSVALATYRQLQGHLAPPHLRTLPEAGYACDATVPQAGRALPVPRLLSAYLALGAWICGPPAMDTEFGSADFLTLMDLQSPAMERRRRHFGLA